MIPTNAVLTAMVARMGTDTVTFDGVQIDLIRAPFTPAPTLTLADLTLADFDGSTALEAPATGLNAGVDPATSDKLLTAMPPAGGWYWETTGTTNLPQTIYGYAMLNNAEATLLATAALPTPIVLTGVGQVVELDNARFVVVQGAIR